MNTTTLKKASVSTQLRDIRLDISWSNIARRYLDKSASWLHHKMDGIDDNGNEVDFTYAERLQLQQALYDFAERIRNAAKEIA